MADIRALLAAEKQSRRINHPHASYSARNILSCSVCNLAIKSEALWEGHLKSANHRRNAGQANGIPSQPAVTQQQSQTQGNSIPGRKVSDSTKRKREIDDVDGNEEQSYAESQRSSNGSKLTTNTTSSLHKRERPNDRELQDVEVGGRKKPKADTDDHDKPIQMASQNRQAAPKKQVSFAPDVETSSIQSPAAPVPAPTIDEDEWAAFESDISHLESLPPTAPQQPPPPPQQQPYPQSASQSSPATMSSTPTYSATITAAPQLHSSSLQTDANAPTETDPQKSRKSLLEAELEAEKEEEQARMEDEFAVMERMEDRVRRLKQKRESLRLGVGVGAGVGAGPIGIADTEAPRLNRQSDDNDDNANGNVDGQEPTNTRIDDDGEDNESGDDEGANAYKARIVAALARASTRSFDSTHGDEQDDSVPSNATNGGRKGDGGGGGDNITGDDDDDDDDDVDVDDWYS